MALLEGSIHGIKGSQRILVGAALGESTDGLQEDGAVVALADAGVALSHRVGLLGMSRADPEGSEDQVLPDKGQVVDRGAGEDPSHLSEGLEVDHRDIQGAKIGHEELPAIR
jgi:hypothetical protein